MSSVLSWVTTVDSLIHTDRDVLSAMNTGAQLAAAAAGTQAGVNPGLAILAGETAAAIQTAKLAQD